MTAPGQVLVLNAGSSSVKAALFDDAGARIAGGQVAHLQAGPRLLWKRGEEATDQALPETTDHAAAVERLLQACGDARLTAVGHRVVHGGVAFAAPCRLDRPALDALRALEPLAPLHQPHNLAAVETLLRRHPEIPQVACFDTAFHRTHEPLVDRFALPRALWDEGVRRYGFHGLSYQHAAEVLAAEHPALHAGRVVVAHLGAGSSLAALRGGRSLDTTMGMTALDGLPMATRPGSLDPGVLLYLLQAKGMSAEALAEMLYGRSGLLGLSGLSGDMKTLAESDDPRAAEARAFYAWRVAGGIAQMAASLQGIDGLVFTGGIGEHDAAIRAAIVARLGWLGFALDRYANLSHARSVGEAGRPPVLLVACDEEGVIAAAARRLLAGEA